MRLKWTVALLEDDGSGTLMAGYGATAHAALGDLFRSVDKSATDAQAAAARVTAAMVKVRGELEGLAAAAVSPQEATGRDD